MASPVVSLINLCASQPNLSASWLFQRAMSAKKESNVSPDFINELLYVNFQSMQVSLNYIEINFLPEKLKCFFFFPAQTLMLHFLSFYQNLCVLYQRLGDPVLRPFLQVIFFYSALICWNTFFFFVSGLLIREH